MTLLLWFLTDFIFSVTLSQCHPWGCGPHETVLQGLLHWHPQETGQDCRLHLWPLLSDQWETWKENWWGLEWHDWRGKSLFIGVCVVGVPVVLIVCLCEQCVLIVGAVSLAHVWKVVLCVCVCVTLYLWLCIFSVAFSDDKPHSSMPPPVLLFPGWPVKRYVAHQSLWELGPLNHHEQSDSCHLLYTQTHTHKCAENCTAIEGKKCTLTQMSWTKYAVIALSSKYFPMACLSADIHITHRSTNTHTLSDTPWLVAISPWCFLGTSL